MINLEDKIIKLIKENINSSIKIIHRGNPDNLNASMLPLVYVSGDDTEGKAGPTQMDDLTHTFTIGIILDRRSGIGGVLNENVSHRQIRELAEGKNSNGTYRDDSVIGILRKNFTLENSAYNQIFTIRYRLRLSKDLITEEARITARISELVSVPQRT